MATKNSWKKLLSYWDWPVYWEIYSQNEIETTWWSPAFSLMIVSDLACGYITFPEHASFYSKSYYARLLELFIDEAREFDHGGRVDNSPSTLCTFFDQDVGCVQPKALVATVGSGKRVFSQHLAFLPSRGSVRTQFATLTGSSKKDGAIHPLKVLLIPAPGRLDPAAFQALSFPALSSNRTFSVQQDWLTDSFVGEIKDTIDKGGEVNGVVFPELSLDQERYLTISDYIENNVPSAEFFISGVSNDCAGARGNYVWGTVFDRAQRRKYTFVQSKHHRWTMNESQVKEYGLDANLPSPYKWWEHISVQSRQLNFVRFRSRSVFSVLICEDLARSDPCHDVIRSIGPNLVFALLMDGPQLKTRWATRYSSTLSDDPGSTVITLTSSGMVKLSQQQRDKNEKQGRNKEFDGLVGQVMDYRGVSRPLKCAEGDKAILITLVPDVQESLEAIDGRSKSGKYWVLGNISTI